MILSLFSCSRLPDPEPELPATFLSSDGVFIINEGNFRLGNGALSFLSYDSAKIYNDIFGKINNRILGDVPNSMAYYGDNTYILVNNSGKIEVVESGTMLSVETIEGLNSPRQIAFADNSKAYVTSMYSDSLTIIDLYDNSISGYINIRRTSESIVVVGQRAFVSEWVGGSEVMVINTLNNRVVDSIEVGPEPESMVVDRFNMVWVLCNGGWLRNNYAELVGINSISYDIQKRFTFPDKLNSPTSLQINGGGDTLYYLESGVKTLSVYDAALPASSLVPETDGHYFYKLGIDPVSSHIFVTDAIDYQQKGLILQYNSGGLFLSQYQTDILPGQMLFKNKLIK
jgi:DNA-binding beta-propeller fold protein YncE